ncbi:MAG: DUF4258 domain-containing protein [Planctomycetes bacterium]|nr:DUF4258 domain-containing protein [Planctomycetota bacterium]
MEIRYNRDPETRLPHIYDHGVSEHEVEEVLRGLGEDYPARRDSRLKMGQTAAGRYLQVFYVPDEDGAALFVITAFEMNDKRKKAFRRRQRRKQR